MQNNAPGQQSGEQYAPPPPSMEPRPQDRSRNRWIVPVAIVVVIAVALASMLGYVLMSGSLRDATPPSTVTDLAAQNPTNSSIELRWTAPGDDGMSGRATRYDIRYAPSIVDSDTRFLSATPCTSEPTPAIAGTMQTFTVTGLSSGTTYYFALKTADEVPNWSLLSNSPSGATISNDLTPPHVVSTTPADGATGVDLLTTVLEITFNEDMDTAKNTTTAVSFTPFILDYYTNWESNRKLQCLFTGNAYPFAGSTKYTAKLEDTYGWYVTDAAGNPLGTYSWSFTTRALNVVEQNQRGYYSSGDYYAFGEILNQESAVIATSYWYLSGSSPLHVDITYYDAVGSVVAGDSVLTSWIGGLRNGQKLPFKDTQSDPSQRIMSFTALINKTEQLWKVTAYTFTISNLQDQRQISGDYVVTGTVQNTGTKQIAVGGLSVSVTFYMSNSKVYDYAEWSNQYIINPGGSENFDCTIFDPIPYQVASYAVLVSNLYP